MERRILPQAVFEELTRLLNEPGVLRSILSVGFTVRPVVNVAPATSLLLDLDAGEGGGHCTRRGVQSGRLLIDECWGWRGGGVLRAEVRRHPRFCFSKPKMTGIFGRDQSCAGRPEVQVAGLHVSEELYETVLQNAGKPS